MKKNRVFGRLVHFECRKAFLNPMMLVFTVFLLLMNGWKVYDSYQSAVSKWQEYESLYADFYEIYCGTITPEKADHLMNIYSPLEEKSESWTLNYYYDPDAYTYSEGMDYDFFSSQFAIEMEYDYLYQNKAYNIVTRAQTLSEFYENVGNRFESEKNQKIKQDFLGRRIPEFADTRGWEVLLHYDYSSMLVLLLMLFGLCNVFVVERETEMYMLLRTTRRGCGAAIGAKLAASALFCIVVCALFYTQDFLTIYFAGHRNEALSSPVYALRTLEVTPLNMTVGGYFLWAAAFRTWGVLACGCYVLLISCLCSQVLSAFFGGLACILGGVVLQEFCRTHYALKWFNPLEMVIGRELVQTSAFVNVLGRAVHLHVFVAAGILIAMAGLTAGILYCNRSYHSRAGRRHLHA